MYAYALVNKLPLEELIKIDFGLTGDVVASDYNIDLLVVGYGCIQGGEEEARQTGDHEVREALMRRLYEKMGNQRLHVNF